MGHFIVGESSNGQTPSSENQQTDTATRIHRDRTPAFIPDGDTQVRLDPGAFYESVYQYVSFYVEKYGAVIPITRKKALKTLSVYRVLLTQGTLKQIHQNNLYLDIDHPDDEVSAVFKSVCGGSGEQTPTEYLSKNG